MTAPTQPTDPWTPVMLDTARTVIDGARSTSDYPAIVGGGAADPTIVMTMTAGLVRRAAMDSDCGAEHLLTEARNALLDGMQQGTATRAEASIGMAVLELADPRRTA